MVTGFGRTGANFGIDHWNVIPDIMATGKGLSSGYTPLAATLTHERIYESIYKTARSFVHGHTYGGNPLSCAIALAVQNYIEKHDLIDRCARMGDFMLEQMQSLTQLPIVAHVRGKGLLLGVEFAADKEKGTPFEVEKGVTAMVVSRCLEKGVLIMPGAPGLIDGAVGDHVCLSPPFTVSEEEIEQIVAVLRESIDEVGKELGY